MVKKKVALLLAWQKTQRPWFSHRINILKRNCPSSPELSEALSCQNQIWGIAFANS
jgi:hypothetical protein